MRVGFQDLIGAGDQGEMGVPEGGQVGLRGGIPAWEGDGRTALGQVGEPGEEIGFGGGGEEGEDGTCGGGGESGGEAMADGLGIEVTLGGIQGGKHLAQTSAECGFGILDGGVHGDGLGGVGHGCGGDGDAGEGRAARNWARQAATRDWMRASKPWLVGW